MVEFPAKGAPTRTDGSGPGGVPRGLLEWCRAAYPEFPHVYAGESGTGLLFHALRQEPRGTVVLPAFICPQLSAMVRMAGKRLVHVDVDPRTMHPVPGLLDECLAGLSPDDTVLLLDHPMGYGLSWIAGVRQRYPGVLLIEDCVRSLGGEIHGCAVGAHGNWALFSLYKTTAQNSSGALLLTRSPYRIEPGPPPPLTLPQRAAMFPLAQALYSRAGSRWNRGYPGEPFDKVLDSLEAPHWTPEIRAPDGPTARRFLREAARGEQRRIQRFEAAHTIRRMLTEAGPAVTFILPSPRVKPSAHFLSFTLPEGVDRDALLTALAAEGLPLLRLWHDVPARFSCFAGTFPFGAAGSLELADRVVHVPLSRYLSRSRQESLTRALRHHLRAAAHG